MKSIKKIAAVAAALTAAVTLSGCVAAESTDGIPDNGNEIVGDGGVLPPEAEAPETELPDNQKPPAQPVPQVKKASYVNVTTSGVNIRSGAGTG